MANIKVKTYDLSYIQLDSATLSSLKLSGSEKLAEQYRKALLTSKGSCVADPSYGGGLAELVASTPDKGAQSLRLQIVDVVDNVNKWFIDMQSSYKLDKEEMLLNGGISELLFDATVNQIALSLVLVNANRRTIGLMVKT